MSIPPRKILLATDFSARSDRAEARALALARQYDCKLLVLHVLEGKPRTRLTRRTRFSPQSRPENRLIERTKRQLLNALVQGGNRVAVRIEEGEPAPTVLRIAQEEGCDLIVTGVARNEMLGRFTLGETVDELMRGSLIPLLIVTDRVHGPYNNIVVASDYSDASRRALQAAAAFFPDQILRILHAHGAPGSYAVDDVESYREQMRLAARRQYLAFLDTVNLPEEQRSRFEVLIEGGNLTELLQDLVESSSIDLVVLGSRVRGLLPEAFVGSIARRIVSSLPCDALVFRGQKA